MPSTHRPLTSAFSTVLLLILCVPAFSEPFNGVDNSLSSLYRASEAESRSISAENFTGERGKGAMATEGTGKDVARNLGQGWKVPRS